MALIMRTLLAALCLSTLSVPAGAQPCGGDETRTIPKSELVPLKLSAQYRLFELQIDRARKWVDGHIKIVIYQCPDETSFMVLYKTPMQEDATGLYIVELPLWALRRLEVEDLEFEGLTQACIIKHGEVADWATIRFKERTVEFVDAQLAARVRAQLCAAEMDNNSEALRWFSRLTPPAISALRLR